METTLSQQMRHMSWLSTKHAKMAAALEEQLRKEDPDMAKMLRKHSKASALLGGVLKTWNSGDIPKIQTSVPFVDRVIGGGVMLGRTYVLSGAGGGSGLTTLMCQVVCGLSESAIRSLYICGDQDGVALTHQLKRVGKNADLKRVSVLCGGSLDDAMTAIQEMRFEAVVIDRPEGFRRQNAMVTSRGRDMLIEAARELGAAVIIVTSKPGLVKHRADCSLALDMSVDNDRRLFVCTKNRFAPSGQTAWLKMTKRGLVEA